MARQWIITIVSLLLAWQALGDGRTFPMVADPLADAASSTMPRQRAIIAWDGTQQRLAIDTAFTGEGTEFAWLVPLPSEPEILPATKGMFDTAAVLTAPEIVDDAVNAPLMAIGVVALIVVLVLLTTRCKPASVVGGILVVFVFVGLLLVLLPMLGVARSSATGPPSVRILDQSSAGLYDTTVLTAENADDLLGWLTANGYGVPAGVSDTVQGYLDKGWCFAAARLSVDAASDGEHRAHPLEFRFPVEAPVYPMALTAVGNGVIELELFVFAEGTARARHMNIECSLPAEVYEDHPDNARQFYHMRRRPVPVSHPGLIEISGDLPVLTRLHAVLSQEQQREDMAIEVVDFREKDPVMYTSEARWWLLAWLAVGFAVIAGMTVVLLRMRKSGDLSPTPRERGASIVAVLAIGLASAALFVALTPVYPGAIGSGKSVYSAEYALESIGLFLPYHADESGGVGSEADVRALLSDWGYEEASEMIRQGDSPLHYRLEAGDTEDSLWFIWHDAIGGEHRAEIPLKTDVATAAEDDSG